MGVHRITSLLHNEGWIPSEQKDDGCACSGRLWKDWNPSMAFLNQGLPLEQIAPNSTFLIDGNGLAFFFFKVAYARHLHSTFRTDGQQSCPPVNAIETADISKALPCMLPLSLLEDITHEFVSHLRLCDLRLQVFWDGPSRRFKTVTLKKRKEQREAEWSNLQQFCVHGSLPNEKHICHFLHHFPFPSMFLQCIRKALQREQVDVVYCQEEADVELARRASGDSGAYVLGQDSDFFFYKDIQYVPLDCIFTSNSSIHASVGRRADLAKLLGLEDEQMIELAILLGNDYVQNIKLPKEKKGIRTMDEQKNPYSVASYLQRQEDGFMVQAQGREAEMAFVRALYDLRDLESFPMQDSSNLTDIPSADEDDEITAHLKVSLPDGLRAQVAMVSQEDTTISDAIQRCLAVYIEQTEDDNDAPLQHEHLAAYMESMASPHNGSTVSLGTRPRWIDVRAAYVIEMCISRILRSSKDSLLVRLTQPGRLFSHYQFHSILASIRPSLPEDIPEGDNDETLTETGPQNATVERKTLPIDAHQDIIVNNIQNNRVTIIHGETGCGKSSRVPIMLLEAPSPEPSLPEVKFFISQPRR
jgi:5'-3' exonuclease